MTTLIDADLVAIRRQRRRQARCAKCGARSGLRALCERCAADWRYCARCAAIVPLADVAPSARRLQQPTDYCRPCGRLMRNGAREPRPAYIARMQAGQHAKLDQIKRLYRRGLTYNAIAEALNIPRGTLGSIVAHARKTGRWPKNLRRQSCTS